MPTCPCSPASDFMGFMAEYLNHHLQLDLEALRHGHPQLRHLSTALVTACRALHRQVAPGTHHPGPPTSSLSPLWWPSIATKAREMPTLTLTCSSPLQ